MAAVQARKVHDIEISFGLRVFNTFAILAAASLLAHVTAPGIDHAALASGYTPLDSTVAQSVSIVALSFSPAISALVIFEAFRLLLPGMRHWEGEEPGRRGRLGLLLLAIAFAAYQGWGVASALEGISANNVPVVADPGPIFRAVFALTQVAGTFLLIAGADAITRYGIGSGWWAMIAATHLIALLASVLMMATQLSAGLLDPVYPLAVAAIAAAGAYVALLLFNKGLEQGHTPAQSAADLILPIFLGSSLGSFLYGLAAFGMAFFNREPISPEMFAWSSPGALGAIAALVILFARLRCRGNRARGLQIGIMSFALYGALNYAAPNAGLHAIRADILIITVMVAALAWQHWKSTALPEAAA